MTVISHNKLSPTLFKYPASWKVSLKEENDIPEIRHPLILFKNSSEFKTPVKDLMIPQLNRIMTTKQIKIIYSDKNDIPLTIVISKDISSIPKDFNIPNSLKYLYFQGLSLKEIPPSIFKLKNCKNLILKNINISDLEKIGELKLLEKLTIGLIRLEDIDKIIFLLKNNNYSSLDLTFFLQKYPNSIPRNWAFNIVKN